MSENEMVTQDPAPCFGQNREGSDRLEAQRVRRVLQRRLCDKIRNYERIAARLEMRGENDAATVLTRAAGQLRAITAEAG